jgi:choline dehydrogenase-like flavoprotein
VILDARTLPHGETLEADVCIVGAGPAGIVLAGELGNAGVRVCVLESGGLVERWRTQRLIGGQSVGLPYPRLLIAAVSAFGGSSHRWGDGTYWHARPLDAIDFERRDAVPHSGWPFSRAELAPFYDRAAAFFELEPFQLHGSETDSDASSVLGVRPGRLTVGELRHGPVVTDRERRRLAAAGSVRVLLHAHVAQLEPDEQADDAIAGVIALTAPGRSFKVRARLAVLAAGGIGNPRLLLLGNRLRPGGIGNEHDLVGRFFMEHPALRSGVVIPTARSLLERRELFGLTDRNGRRARPTIALSEHVLREEGLLNTYFMLEPRPQVFAAEGVRSASTLARALRCQPLPSQLASRAASVVADMPAVARAALAPKLGLGDDILVVRVQSEQAPNPHSRVSLADSRNAFGVREARLDWRLADLDTASIRRSQELLGEELRLAGLGDLEDLLGDEHPPALIAGHYHHIGTTRMHEDPRRGVVDQTCRVHGTRNLYVAGSSVFPTSGAANPTLTIVALAMRLADHIRAVLAG